MNSPPCLIPVSTIKLIYEDSFLSVPAQPAAAQAFIYNNSVSNPIQSNDGVESTQNNLSSTAVKSFSQPKWNAVLKAYNLFSDALKQLDDSQSQAA